MKNQTIVLNMNKQQAYNLIKQMANNIQNEINIPVRLDKNRKTKTGFITNPQIQTQPQSIVLGCQNIKTILKRKELVNTNDFIGCIIAGYHEQQHYRQIHGQMQNQPPTEKEQLTSLNSMICIHNSNYYKMNGNYYNQLCEIDAEQQGLTDAYVFLKNHLHGYSDQDCQQFIVDYVNQRVQENPYYIPQKEYHSFTEIIQEFDQSFQNALATPKPYYMAGYKSYPDIAMQYMWQHDDTTRMDSGHSFLHDTYLNYQTGTECEKMIGCITKLQIPTCTDTYVYLQDMDLSPETILGVSLHKDPKEPWKQTQVEPYSCKQERSDRSTALEALYENLFDTKQTENENNFSL